MDNWKEGLTEEELATMGSIGPWQADIMSQEAFERVFNALDVEDKNPTPCRVED